MTDPGTPTEGPAPDPGPAAPGPTGPGPAPADAAPARARRRRWLRWTALGTSVLVLAAAGVGWTLFRKLDGNIRTDSGTAEELARHEDERPGQARGDAQNILLLGSDSRDGKNSAYGREGGERADTTILLHLSADRSAATAVSLPRDLMVDIPGCRTPDGGRSTAQFAQFNWAFQFGGAACTIRTVERLTGIRIDHHLVVDFSGFKRLVNAVGGVEVCLPHEVHDIDARLDLAAGRQVLRGEDALGYVRARKGFDGSDTQRMDRQQQFLGSLVQKVRDERVLLDPSKLYPFLDAATSALTADEGLDSLGELYELTRSLRDIPEEGVRFLTVPRRPYAMDANRDELVQPAADRLFNMLRTDRAIRVADHGTDAAHASDERRTALRDGTPAEQPSPGSPTRPPSGSPSVSPPPADPLYRGTTAARDVCTRDSETNEGN